MYKIGLCGAGGTGKGTFGKKLAEVLEKKDDVLLSKLYASPVQRVGRALFPQAKNFADFSPERRMLYQYAILGAQTEIELNADDEGFADICIFERTFFDYLAYANGLNEDWQEEYEDAVLNAYYKDPYENLAEHSMVFEITGDLDQRINKALRILCREIVLLV